MPFYGAEESDTSVLFWSRSLLEGLKFTLAFGEYISLGYFNSVHYVKVLQI